jgi:transposase
MRRKRASKGGAVPSLPRIEADAAGIDVGATEIFVAVPEDRDPQPIRCFTTFTEDLQALAAWLLACRIRTVAMESTGVYWIPVFQVLEARGLEVCLVNSQHVKHVPGRKSDVADCRWLQFLHSVGLLRSSFRPEDAICRVRSLLRHRDGLVEMAAEHIQHMQKALSQMNLQLHHVLSDLTGKSGMAILDAILAGERNPQVLANLRDGRVKASPETIVKSLVGDYRREHLFTLRQSLESYRHYQALMAACDREIEDYLKEFDSKIDIDQYPLPLERYPHRRRKNEFHFDMRTELYRILGVDLTAIPGFDAITAHAVLAEVGRDLSRFRNAAAFVSWLGLCPQNKKSGGRVLSTKTRRTKNRLNSALRVAAQTLHRSQTYLGAYYRRMRARLGAPKANTAAAHKLARILFHLLTAAQPFDENVFAADEQRRRRRMENRLCRQAREFGFQLVALPA